MYYKGMNTHPYCTTLSDAEWALLEPLFLPTYSPQLNLIERLWRYVKQQLACHRWWNNLDRLITATKALLTNLEAHIHATDGLAFRPAQNFSNPLSVPPDPSSKAPAA